MESGHACVYLQYESQRGHVNRSALGLETNYRKVNQLGMNAMLFDFCLNLLGFAPLCTVNPYTRGCGISLWPVAVNIALASCLVASEGI